tara:strand:+ start:158 stop:322 length:165 start_codon:yes stop_codon:yes gene_type:complete
MILDLVLKPPIVSPEPVDASALRLEQVIREDEELARLYLFNPDCCGGGEALIYG